jgi:hypothetical protein
MMNKNSSEIGSGRMSKNQKILASAAIAVALVCTALWAGNALGAFSQTGTIPAGGTQTTTSAPPTAADFGTVTITPGQDDQSNIIGSCNASPDGQSLNCTKTTVQVGESFTVTVVDSNPNNVQEPITPMAVSGNTSVYTVFTSADNPSAIPANGQVSLSFTATCVGVGSTDISLTVSG